MTLLTVIIGDITDIITANHGKKSSVVYVQITINKIAKNLSFHCLPGFKTNYVNVFEQGIQFHFNTSGGEP